MSKPHDDRTLNQLAERIENLCRDENISLTQLAYESGIDVSHLRKIRKGETDPGITKVKSIARAFKKSLPDFLQYDTHDEIEKQ
jgi:transcriptional regulator with XRE-family HTH domain